MGTISTAHCCSFYRSHKKTRTPVVSKKPTTRSGYRAFKNSVGTHEQANLCSFRRTTLQHTRNPLRESLLHFLLLFLLHFLHFLLHVLHHCLLHVLHHCLHFLSEVDI